MSIKTVAAIVVAGVIGVTTPVMGIADSHPTIPAPIEDRAVGLWGTVKEKAAAVKDLAVSKAKAVTDGDAKAAQLEAEIESLQAQVKSLEAQLVKEDARRRIVAADMAAFREAVGEIYHLAITGRLDSLVKEVKDNADSGDN